jgi:hypothetical protein
MIYGRNTDAVFPKKRNNGFIMFDVIIARYEILRTALYGRFNDQIVIFIPAKGNLAGNRNGFTSLFDQNDQFLDIIRMDKVFVHNPWTLEDINHFFKQWP